MSLKFVGRFSLQQRKNAPPTTKIKNQTPLDCVTKPDIHKVEKENSV
jgi:hypothetical protein